MRDYPKCRENTENKKMKKQEKKHHAIPSVGFERDLSRKSVDFIRKVVNLTTRKKVKTGPETGFGRDLFDLNLASVSCTVGNPTIWWGFKGTNLKCI